jgi:Glycosyltransferase (GlcNAc)
VLFYQLIYLHILRIILIGLTQQIHTEKDITTCLESYCKLMDSKVGSTCPHYSQIRSIIVAHHDARGPAYAHHFGDHLLGDEEFCMQFDSHRLGGKVT